MLNYTYIENPTKEFCSYLTVYSGDKLPPYYIGSTNCNNVLLNNYHGSVSSKKYLELWKLELKNNPSLFTTHIISEHSDRKEAIVEELKQQKNHNVVKNPLFINQSFACKDGCCGMDVKGELNPNFGNKMCETSKQKLRDCNIGMLIVDDISTGKRLKVS